jgi:hypothetical protein
MGHPQCQSYPAPGAKRVGDSNASRRRTTGSHYDQAAGILDHEFIDPKEGSWQVSARMVPAGANDSIYMITLARPPSMPEEAFRQGMPLVEEELQTMRRILARQE